SSDESPGPRIGKSIDASDESLGPRIGKSINKGIAASSDESPGQSIIDESIGESLGASSGERLGPRIGKSIGKSGDETTVTRIGKTTAERRTRATAAETFRQPA